MSLTGRADSRPSCPPPISLKQSQQNMSTRSKYTPLRRGGSNTAKTDPETPSSDAAAAAKDVEAAVKLEKTKSNVCFFFEL